MTWNRVWAIGRGSTYVRFYPNPGIGIKWFRKWRLAVSVHRGVEWKRVK